MFRCSGSSSVCLTSFSAKTAAAVRVQTFFLENAITGLLDRVTRGYLAGAAAALGRSQFGAAPSQAIAEG